MVRAAGYAAREQTLPRGVAEGTDILMLGALVAQFQPEEGLEAPLLAQACLVHESRTIEK
jgi:hypothetical protein